MKETGGPTRKPVLKVDRSLTVIAAYRSVLEAARRNGIKKGTMQDLCELKNKCSVSPGDGILYVFDDEAQIRTALARAAAELDALGIRYNRPETECYWELPEERQIECTPIKQAD